MGEDAISAAATGVRSWMTWLSVRGVCYSLWQMRRQQFKALRMLLGR
jgi:hypothetical protein